jgi:hypothetical protein
VAELRPEADMLDPDKTAPASGRVQELDSAMSFSPQGRHRLPLPADTPEWDVRLLCPAPGQRCGGYALGRVVRRVSAAA